MVPWYTPAGWVGEGLTVPPIHTKYASLGAGLLRMRWTSGVLGSNAAQWFC